MPHRASRSRPLTRLAAPLLAALLPLAPTLAQAQPRLQNCQQGVSGELPIGTINDPGFAWKKTIVDWMTPFQDSDFAWVEPLVMEDPLQAHGVGYAPNGTLCPFGGAVQPAPWAITPQERLHLEQLYLLVATKFTLPWQWFTHHESTYVLDKMIDEANCQVQSPDLAWGDSLAFFASWEYLGSPFRPGLANNDVLKRRLAAWLGLQLIMLDFAHYLPPTQPPASGLPSFVPHNFGVPTRFKHPRPYTPGQGMNPTWYDMRIGAELGAQLGLMAWTFGHVRSILDPVTEDAYQEALLTMAERVRLWNPYFPQINRGIRSAYGLRYVWEQTQDADAWTWYQDTLTQFFDPSGGNWIEGGYWRDDYGLDLGYGGASLMAAERTISEDPGAPQYVHDAVALSQELVAHLALPDLDGRWVAPTAFNARTPNGPIIGVAPNTRDSYYGGVQRYLLGLAANLPFSRAFLHDVDYLGPQGFDALDPRVDGFQENLACLATGYIALGVNPPLANPIVGQVVWPSLTRSQDFGPPPTYVENHSTQRLVDLWNDLQQQPQDALMPAEVSGTTIRNFAGRFVFGRFGGAGSGNEYAAVLHLGEVGQLPGGGESGFGGGQISAFWTADGGPTLLGLRKGRSGSAADNDDWTAWRTFPLHAVTVHTAADKVTTSARIITPTTQVFTLAQDPSTTALDAALDGTGNWASPATVPDHQAVAVLARVSGKIPKMGHSAAAAPGAITQTLTAPIPYERAFLMGEAGLWVQSTVGAGHPADLITEAWETVPIWNRDTVNQPNLADPVIFLHSSSQGAVDASLGTLAPVPDVHTIEIFREQGYTIIHLDNTERLVQVSDPWVLTSPTYFSRESRTLLIDRLPTGCSGGPGCQLAPDVLRYFIEEVP